MSLLIDVLKDANQMALETIERVEKIIGDAGAFEVSPEPLNVVEIGAVG